MYDQIQTEAACFDPNIIPEPVPATTTDENGFSHDSTTPTPTTNITITPPFTPIDHLHHHHHHHHHHDHQIDAIINPTQDLHELDPSMEINHHHHNNTQNPHLLGAFTTTDDANTWQSGNHEMGFVTQYEEIPTSTTDLLTLLHLPRCNFPSSSSISLGNPAAMVDNPSGSGSSSHSYDPSGYDPLFHLNLPPQPSPLLRDLMFQSLPHGYGGIQTRGNGNGNGNNSLFLGLDEGERNMMNGVSGIYQDGDHHHMHSNGIFEFNRGNACLGEGKEGKVPKNFVTEQQRRQNFNDKFQHLRSLVPSPTKNDRASIVGDAINYIQELKRTVGELKLLVEKKRISKERVKRLKTEDNNTPGGAGDLDINHNNIVQGVDGPGLVKPDPDEAFNGSAATQIRSSWLQRKCKDTEVDVRIVDDDVTIKLVQRKKINCLLSVSRTLDELQLDLSHVAGGHVGDYYSYLFNTKICEGSSVYASAIANKLVEVVERQYATASVSIAPTSSF